MEPIIAILVAPLVAGYLASLLCRLALRRNRCPSWLIAPLTIALGVVLSLAVIFQKDLFHPSRACSKFEGYEMLAFFGVPALLLAAGVAIPAVRGYQKDYVEHHPKP